MTETMATSSYPENPEQQPSGASPQGREHRLFSKWRLFYALLYLTALVFLILVEIGNLSDKPVLRDIYFLKIDLSEIIPRSVPNAVLINSIARSIGLHDFYQVGLWNFCEGYDDGTGITHCSKPETLYFFNPVEILLSELLSGATIALPSGVTQALDIARIASNWMFGLFFLAAVLSFVCIFLTPFSMSTRHSTATSSTSTTKRRSHSAKKRYLFPLTILTFATFLFTLAASGVATAMFAIFRMVFVSNEADLNIHAELGSRMLAFMWIATGLTGLGFIFHAARLCACCCCCCRSRKHVRENEGGNHGEKGPFSRRNEPALSTVPVNAEGEKGGSTRRRFQSWRRMGIGA